MQDQQVAGMTASYSLSWASCSHSHMPQSTQQDKSGLCRWEIGSRYCTMSSMNHRLSGMLTCTYGSMAYNTVTITRLCS